MHTHYGNYYLTITTPQAHLLYLGIQPLPIIHKTICTSQFSFTLNLSILECSLESIHVGVDNVSLITTGEGEHQTLMITDKPTFYYTFL